MQKWMRNFRAEFEIGERDGNKFTPTQYITISYPFSVQFDISSTLRKANNSAVFQFINLSENDRNTLHLDVWNGYRRYIKLTFYAGYGDTMPMIFKGNIRTCTSSRASGSTEFITEVIGMDSAQFFGYGYLNATFTAGTTLEDILKVATQDMGDVSVGYITPDISPLTRNRTFIGQTLDLITREYPGYAVYVDKDEINILGDRDVVPGEVQVISDESGLLGSPKRGTSFVEAELIFEPQLTAGQAVVLQSSTLLYLNRAYKINTVRHSGIISPVMCGSLITTVTLAGMYSEPKELKKSSEKTYSGKQTTGIWRKPVQGKITSPFGYRDKPLAEASKNHKGIDIGAPLNTPVYAPANGKVTAVYISGSLTTDFGRFVSIDHGKINGKLVTSWYGHLNSWTVNNGQNVSQGDLIGYVGSTGYSTGPHLHFQVNENGIPINPTIYIGNYG